MEAKSVTQGAQGEQYLANARSAESCTSLASDRLPHLRLCVGRYGVCVCVQASIGHGFKKVAKRVVSYHCEYLMRAICATLRACLRSTKGSDDDSLLMALSCCNAVMLVGMAAVAVARIVAELHSTSVTAFNWRPNG